MILVYDTETTGLVHSDLAADHGLQPHLVQLGLVLVTDTGQEVASAELMVKPDGYSIPEGAAKIHGITTAIATECGVPLATVLSVFTQLRANAKELVAFNMDFDDLVIRSAISRLGRKPSHPGPALRTCCMRAAMPIMKLPPTAKMMAAGYDKYKPPNLKEAHRFFCGEDFVKAHSALADARACLRIHFAMLKMEPAV